MICPRNSRFESPVWIFNAIKSSQAKIKIFVGFTDIFVHRCSIKCIAINLQILCDFGIQRGGLKYNLWFSLYLISETLDKFYFSSKWKSNFRIAPRRGFIFWKKKKYKSPSVFIISWFVCISRASESTNLTLIVVGNFFYCRFEIYPEVQ